MSRLIARSPSRLIISALLGSALFVASSTASGSAVPAPMVASASLVPVWSRVLGGGSETQATSVAHHPDGGIVVVALTSSTGLVPAGGNPYDSTFAGGEDVWVGHYSDSGILLWATYLGGISADWPSSVDVTNDGIFVGGLTYSSDFAAESATAHRLTTAEPFVVRLSLDGSRRDWVWQLASSDGGVVQLAATVGGGAVVVAGVNADVAVSPGAADTTRVGYEGLVTKLDASGQVVWMSYLGGSGGEIARAVALRSDGSIAVAGNTSSLDFPTTAGAYDTTAVPGGDITGFVSVLSADGSTIEWSSYFGSTANTPNGHTIPMDLEVDAIDGIYLSGNTERADLPVHPSALSTTPTASEISGTGFVAHFAPSGDNVDAATYLPGLRDPVMTKGTAGSLLVAGAANGSFVTTDGTTNTNPGGLDGVGLDAGLYEVDLALDHVLHATVIGGSNFDGANGVMAIDGGAVLVGITMSSDFPGSYPISTYHGTVVRLTLTTATPPPPPPPPPPTPTPQSIKFTPLTGKVLGDAPFSVSATATSGLAVSFVSDSPAVCTVSGATVTLTRNGECTVRASQPGNSFHLAAPDVVRTFAVVVLPPTITDFTPSAAGVRSSISIAGTNLLGATAVRFNGKKARGFTVVSSTQITVGVPVGATTGKITVTTAGGTAASGLDFVVVPTPTITLFTPATGGAGTEVAITGTGFGGATALLFSGASTPFTVVSPTQIVAAVPPGVSSGRIVVSTPGGTASRSRFRVIPIPTITSVTPQAGGTGTKVKIKGMHFSNATAVTFNGSPAAFTVTNSSLIKATIPAGVTTGQLTVTTPGGSATSNLGVVLVTP